MAQYYQIVQNVDDIKNIYNLDQVQLVMGDDLQFGSQVILTQDQSEIILNDSSNQQMQQIVYTHPQSQQIPQAETHYLIQDDGQLINDGTFNQPNNQQIFYQEVPAIMQASPVPQLQQQQQPVVILRQAAPHEQQQQHTMMMQQQQSVILQPQPHPQQMVHHQQQQQQIMYNAPPPHQAVHQSPMPPPPLVHTSPPQPRPQMVNQSPPPQQRVQKIPTQHMMQNTSGVVVGQPQMQQGQVVMTQRMPNHQPQMSTPHLQQMGQVRPVRVTKPRVSRPHVQRPRAPGAVVRTRAPVKAQMANVAQGMRPPVMQDMQQNQQASSTQVVQQRNNSPSGGPVQRVVQITNRQQTQTMMISNPNQPGQVVRAQLRKVSINQVSQQTVSQTAVQPQQAPQPPQTVTKSGSGNDLEDLEDSIQSAVIKRPMDAEMHSPPPQPIESAQNNVQMVMEQPPPPQQQKQQQQQQQNQQQQQQQQQIQVQMAPNQNVYEQMQVPQQVVYHPNQIIQLADGRSITMAEFHQFQESQQRKQQENVREGFIPTRGGPRPPMSFGRGNAVRKPMPMNRQQMALQQQQQQMDQQRMQQQQQQQALAQQHEEENRESAKMLVILQSGEQRLITFTLPKESCTVQELLEQVGVQFSSESPIQCISNPGGDVDYIVTVGVTLQETNDYVKSAEESIKKKGTPQQQPQQPQYQEVLVPQPPMTSQPPLPQQPQQLNQTPRFNDSYRQQIMQTPTQVTPTIDPKAEDIPKMTPKVLKAGFLAVCKFCGATGMNHAQCDRCKRVFVDPPKSIKESKTPSNPPPLVPTATSTPMSKYLVLDKTDKEKKVLLEVAQKNHQIAIGGRGSGHAVRGMGRGRGRGRGVAKHHEVEPVIFTLSSDDEESHSEDKSKSMSKLHASMGKNSFLTAKAMNSCKAPLLFEPIIKEEDKLPDSGNETIREDVSNIKGMPSGLITQLEGRSVRIGSWKYDATEKVVISSKGIRLIAPNVKRKEENCILDLQYKEIIKIVIHFSKSLNVLFIYTLPSCGSYIRESLEMSQSPDEKGAYYNPLSRADEMHRRITLVLEKVSEESKSVIKSIFSGQKLEEISLTDANQLLVRTCNNKFLIDAVNSSTNNNTVNNSIDSGAAIRKILIYPPGKGGISINTEDYMCLAIDQYLNDVIIDFYLNYIKRELLKEDEKEMVYIFSTFFYKRLTTVNSRHRASDRELKLTAAQKRHGRVASWTKKDNIFEKDFIIIPINEQSHWFLAIICFPHMEQPINITNNTPTPVAKKKKLTRKPSNMSLQIGNTTITPVSKKEIDTINIQDDDASERDEAEGDESELASDNDEESEEEVQTRPAVKQPCILIFDSLSGAARSRVVATLRDYLTCEYKVKMPNKLPKVFTKANMPGHCVKVPQQNNFTDCGLYLLQYVEQFFLDPVRDYHLPVRHLSEWFDTLTVTRKREEISNLLKDLISQYSPDVLPLPDIKFPTMDGKLIVDPDEDHFNEGEFEEEELEEAMVADDSGPNGNKVLTTKLVSKVAKRPLEEKEENIARKTPKIVEESTTSLTNAEESPVMTATSSS